MSISKQNSAVSNNNNNQRNNNAANTSDLQMLSNKRSDRSNSHHVAGSGNNAEMDESKISATNTS